MPQKIGYSANGNIAGYISEQIQDGLDKMQAQIASAKETLKKSRESSNGK